LPGYQKVLYIKKPEDQLRKNAKRVGNKLTSCSNQAIFSHTSRQTKNQNIPHPKTNSGTDWTRDDEGLLAPVPPE